MLHVLGKRKYIVYIVILTSFPIFFSENAIYSQISLRHFEKYQLFHDGIKTHSFKQGKKTPE